MTSDRVWIVPVQREELDARKLSRAFLALALHEADDEAEAQRIHEEQTVKEDEDDPA